MMERQRNTALLAPCPQSVSANIEAVGPFQSAAMNEHPGEVRGVFERIEKPPGFRLDSRFEIEDEGFPVLGCDFENETVFRRCGMHRMQFARDFQTASASSRTKCRRMIFGIGPGAPSPK